jgi:hypothetical protein
MRRNLRLIRHPVKKTFRYCHHSISVTHKRQSKGGPSEQDIGLTAETQSLRPVGAVERAVAQGFGDVR